MRTPPPVPVTTRRLRVEQGGIPAVEGRTSAQADPFQHEQGFWLRFWEQLNGPEGASYALSFVLHVILLALFAIPVYRSLTDKETFTTVVQNNVEDQVVIDQPVNTEAALVLPDNRGGDELKTQLLDPLSSEMAQVPDVDPAEFPSLPGEEGKAGHSVAGGNGVRIAEPKNAIRAGSFSAWPWPVIGKDVRGRILHGEPGSAPKVLQDYDIVIRLKVPDGRKTVNLADFSGEIIGTDHYQQKIPQDAYYFNGRGDLVRGRTGRSIPVIDGTAELLIRVPGAGSPNIRDKIKVYSRILDETQTFELVFRAR